MGTRVGVVALGLSMLACSGEDAGPAGAGTGTGSGARGGGAGTASLDVGGRAGQAGSAGLGGSGGAAGLGGSGGAAGGFPSAARTIAPGDDHSCAIGADGTVSCWGYRGDLPTEDTRTILSAPSQVKLPAVEALVGQRHFCAVAKGTRALFCWGQEAPNASLAAENPFPAAIDVGAPVDEVAVALRTTCVRVGTNVSCFGLTALGGTGATSSTQARTPVPGITDALSLVGHGLFFCARRPALGAGGGVRATCWGEGLPTPTDVPGETDVAGLAITADGDVLVRRGDGSVSAHRAPAGSAGGGFGPVSSVGALAGPVDAIAADNALCAIRSADKAVVCASLVNRTPATIASFVEVTGLPAGDPAVELATNATHTNYGLDTTCARTAAGKTFCWGADRWAQTGAGLVGWELTPKTVPGVSNARAISVGHEGSVALVESGPAVGWGALRALDQQLQDGTAQKLPKALPGKTDDLAGLTIGGFDDRIYGITKTGGVYAAEYGQAATDAGLQAFPGKPAFLPGAVRLDQIDFGVAGVGSGTFLAFFVPNATDAALGDSGILANGGGPAKTTYSSRPLPDLVGFAHGPFHGLAWDAMGSLHCWGLGDTPRCGQPASQTKNVLEPVVIPLPGEAIVSACGGWDHTCAITQANKLRCWGRSNNGVGGKPEDETQADDKGLGAEELTGVACGTYSTCAWSSSKVYCWGMNTTGLLGVGDLLDRPKPTLVPGLPGAKHIAIDQEHACAVKTDGTVACWGSPSGGRLGNGALGYTLTEARPVLGLP